MTTIEQKKLIADFMGKRYDYLICDNCGMIDPVLLNSNSRLTKCCSTYDKESPLCFYTTTDAEGKEVYSIGKTLSPHGSSGKELNYDTCWDNWLMPVVERIETLGFIVEISCKTCVIKGKEGIPFYCEIVTTFTTDETETKLSITFKAIVKFIEWYGKENKN